MTDRFEDFIRDLLGVCSRKPHPKEGRAAVALIREIEGMASRMRDELQREKESYVGPARAGHEAQYGLNDFYPGDPYPTAASAETARVAELEQRLIQAVEIWGDGHDANRVYNARQSAVMKALNNLLDAKAALGAQEVRS